jgi:protein phosphatase
MIYTWASATSVGLVRDNNEDSVAPGDMGVAIGPFIAGVADGMGGHVGGEIASATALDAAMSADGGAVARAEVANRAVVAKADEEPHLAGMGTTLTLAVFSDDSVDIGHIGDSRAYLLRDGTLIQLTEDHSLVAEMVSSGELDPAEAPYHPYRNVITRAIGLAENVPVDRVTKELQPADRLLLCTDGLTNMVEPARIREVLEDKEHPNEAAWALVEAANAAGGLDNISTVVIDVAGDTAS